MLPLLKNPCTTFSVADLKQIRLLVTSPAKRWIQSGSAEKFNWKSTTRESPRKGATFTKGKRKLGGLSHRVRGFSLAESPPGKKSLSSPCWALLSSQGVTTPQFGLPTLFHWDFCLLINIFTVLPGWNLNSFVNCTKIFRISLLPKSGLTLSTFCLQNNTCPSHTLSKTSLHLSVYLLEKAMAPRSSTLAWKIPWTEEHGRLQSMGSLRVGHDCMTSLSLSTFMHWRRKWQPTPVFLPGESQGRGSLVGFRLWGHTESDTTEAT